MVATEDNLSIFSRVVEKGEPYTAYAKPFEYAEHPERGVTYWDWTLHPVKKVSGKVEGLVLGLVNVTERIKTEERLRFLSSQLLTAQENEVPEPLKMVIFRVLQEAMNNIVKHSDADLVRLCFKKTDATIWLTIEDNGRGFDLEGALSLNSSEKGFGITSMKERTELAGGSFAIDSTPGAGTVVRASWPSIP